MANDLVAELQSVRRWIGNGSRGAVGMQKKIDGISAEIERLRASKPIAEGATDNGMKPLTGDALRSAVDQYCASTNDAPVERLVEALEERATVACDAECNGDRGDHDAGCVRATALLRALSSPSGEAAQRVVDPQPEIIGSPLAKIVAYNQMHETAVEMGYPSILEALEHLDELREGKPTPTDTADTPPASAVDRAAQAIYEHWAFDDRAPNPKPKWVPGGNSEKQDIARRLARAALTTEPTTGVVDCPICHNNGSDCQVCVGGAMTIEQAAEWLRAQAIATAPTAPVDREAVISAIEAKIGGAFHGATGRAVATEVYDAIVSLLPKIPEGWVLVPREPTEAMIDAAVDAVLDYNHNDDHAPHQIHKDAWSAMIAASPNPGEGA